MIGANALYAMASAMRLEYGPAFRMVAAIRGAGRAAIVDLLPDTLAQQAAGHLVAPVLLDGALQGLLGLAAASLQPGTARTVLPWRFGRVRMLMAAAATPAATPVHARLRVTHVGSRSIQADILLLDARHEPVLECLNCWFAAVPLLAAGGGEPFFHTRLVPASYQPTHSPALSLGTLLATAGLSDGSLRAGTSLIDAFLCAVAWEALQPHGEARLPGAGASKVALEMAWRWLVEDGLAECAPGGWHMLANDPLPPSDDIWRQAFSEARAADECALAASLGRWLEHALRAEETAVPAGAGDLVRPMFVAAAWVAAAERGLLSAYAATLAAWPVERPMRVAVLGPAEPGFLRALADAAQDRGMVAHVQMLRPGPDASHPGGEDGFDIVLGLFVLAAPGSASSAGADRLAPAAAARLLAPSGTLLLAELQDSRLLELWEMATRSGTIAARFPRAAESAVMLRATGLLVPEPVPLGAEIWSVCLIAAQRSATAAERADAGAEPLIFAAQDDPVAAHLGRETAPGARPRPLDGLGEFLRSPTPELDGRPVVLSLACVGTDDTTLSNRIAHRLAVWTQAIQTAAGHLRLWVVCSLDDPQGGPGTHPLAAALAGWRRVVANERPDVDLRLLYVGAGLAPDQAAGLVRREIAEGGPEREIVLTPAGRLVPRLRPGLPNPPAATGSLQLAVERPGALRSLRWQAKAAPVPGPGEVAIAVGAVGLNFRDLMWALGLLPEEALMHGLSRSALGLECAGWVTAVGPGVLDLKRGDKVAAMAQSAMASDVVTGADAVLRLPAELGLEQAATIPVAFATAVYALGRVAALQPGERILIHSGAGGVGQAAIQYALHRGAIVYSTAGSAMRRDMLRRLGVTDAFDSRGASFVDDVLHATDGRGVDVVLNSLGGMLLERGMALLRPFGRFVEIGKRDLYANTAVGLRPLRRNASFLAVDLDEVAAQRPALLRSVLDEVAGLLAEGRLRPLPRRCFAFADVAEAFRLMQSSGHIGKIVLMAGPVPRPPVAFAARADGAYVVTGGLSGFGLAAAEWLLERGARTLVLLSRRGEAAPGAADAVRRLKARGAMVAARRCDVADAAELELVLGQIRRAYGPLAGVVHAAMVLDDASLGNLDAARFAAVIRPKLAGAAALDRLTRSDPLGLFLLFSSVSAVIGTPGQANYAAANAAMEAIAVRRHAAGLPALAVQWGPVADTGTLARDPRASEVLAKILGSRHATAAALLSRLDEMLAAGVPVAGCGEIDWPHLRRQLPGIANAGGWEDMPSSANGAAASPVSRAMLRELPEEEARAAIQEIVLGEISAILRQPIEGLDADRPLADLGIDSLMAVELVVALRSRLDVDLPTLAQGGEATLSRIAGHLLSAVQGGAETTESELNAMLARHELDSPSVLALPEIAAQ